MTFILGLTGSIGMGKTATAGLFRDLGIPVHDADGAVHLLYRTTAVQPIGAAFPAAIVAGVVDRKILGAEVLNDPEKLRLLESIVHPLVRQMERDFLRRAEEKRADLAVLDIPLLLETGGETRCDAVIVISAPAHIQKERVMARSGMTEEKFNAVLAQQMPDAEKRRRAHFVVDTSRGFADARRQVRSIIRCLAGRPGRVKQSGTNDVA